MNWSLISQDARVHFLAAYTAVNFLAYLAGFFFAFLAAYTAVN
ncbi:hypothetical protein [Pseudomonas aeruginosa]